MSNISSLPRELEITREFEAVDPDEADGKGLRERLAGADFEVDLRNLLGRAVDRLSFAEVTWARFREFVQKVGRPADREVGLPVEKTELATRVRLRER